jgi:hypothetical protein
MTSFIPGAGMKKPLNMLEGPVYPDIRQELPQFKWSRKHWKVDAGRTMLEMEKLPQFVEGGGVLVQSRDYNKQFAYGVSSHRDYVNETFRPPLLDRDDYLPLSRIPRPIVVPRINPGTAFDDQTAFAYQNEKPSEIYAFMTDRIKDSQWRPTFFAPVDMPKDNSVLPDLETTLPSYSVSAGYTFPNMFDAPIPEPHLDYDKLVPDHEAGITIPLLVAGHDAREDMILKYNRPQVSASAKVDSVSGASGVTPINYELNYNRPQVSAVSGRGDLLGGLTSVTPIDLSLEYKQPQVSASSGRNDAVTSVTNFADQTRTDFFLDKKIDAPNVSNPSLPTGTTLIDDIQPQPSTMKLTDVRTAIPYEVPYTVPYASTIARDTKMPVQYKKDALSKYQGYTNRGFIPRSGVEDQNVRLRQIVEQSKKKYSFGRT